MLETLNCYQSWLFKKGQTKSTCPPFGQTGYLANECTLAQPDLDTIDPVLRATIVTSEIGLHSPLRNAKRPGLELSPRISIGSFVARNRASMRSFMVLSKTAAESQAAAAKSAACSAPSCPVWCLLQPKVQSWPRQLAIHRIVKLIPVNNGQVIWKQAR